MSHTFHGRTVCSCGVVISQCRCPEDTTETVVPNGCRACSDPRAVVPAKIAQQAVLTLEKAAADLATACELLRRAADRLTTAAANVLSAPPDDYQVIDDIGAFLARVGTR